MVADYLVVTKYMMVYIHLIIQMMDTPYIKNLKIYLNLLGSWWLVSFSDECVMFSDDYDRLVTGSDGLMMISDD